MKKIKKTFVWILGIIFIIIGLIGLVLPIVQGILFLAIGFFLLSLCSPKVSLHINKHAEKYPNFHQKLKKVEAWVIEKVGEI